MTQPLVLLPHDPQPGLLLDAKAQPLELNPALRMLLGADPKATLPRCLPSNHLHLVRACLDTGVGVPSMCLSGHRRFPFGSHDPAIVARANEVMDKAIALARDNKLPVIVFSIHTAGALAAAVRGEGQFTLVD